MKSLLCAALFTLSLRLSGQVLPRVGAWSQFDKTPLITDRFTPEFVILKLGAFGNAGRIRPRLTTSQINEQCSRGGAVEGWVAHALKKNETLSGTSGTRLAQDLNILLGTTCIGAIEIDLEPMIAIPSWLLDFLGHLRRGLNSRYRLHLAAPLVITESIPGIHWPAESLASIMPVIDGLDMMAYDTGATTPAQYREWLTRSIRSALSLVERFTNKEITIGLPAYYDRTRWHHSAIESTSEALSAIWSLGGQWACHPKLRYAFYAQWTMRPIDRTMAARLVKWRKHGCH